MANKPSNMRIWRETEFNVTPANPKAFLIRATALTLSENQSETQPTEFGQNGEASSPVYGATDYVVSTSLIKGQANSPLISEMVYGKATSGGPKASGAWTATTVVAAGDVLAHSNGTNDLVCRVAGTTGATEPTIPADAIPDVTTIDDNGVIWVVQEKLYTHTGTNQQCNASFGIEIEETDCDGNLKYRRATGCRINSVPKGQAGNDIIYEMALEGFGANIVDDDHPVTQAPNANESYVNIASVTGYTEVDLTDNRFYNYEDSSFTINGIKPLKVLDVQGTCNRNVTYENTVNQSKIDNIGIIQESGTLNAVFDKSIFDKAFLHEDVEFKFSWATRNGFSYEQTLPRVKMNRANKTYDTQLQTRINVTWSAYGTATQSTVEWTMVSTTPYPL